MACVGCGSAWVHRDGRTRHGQRWRCFVCRRRYTARSDSAFSRYRFPDEVIGLAVRWYVRFRLRYADVVALLAARGVQVDRSTVYRWVQRFLPSLHVAARRHRQPVGVKWRVDETYCRLGGRWAYCSRAIDQHGQVVDVLFSERRNAAAARRFFERAIDRAHVEPERVTTDRAGCYPPALRQVLPGAEHRCSKYLNNGIERDHQHLKQRLRPMRPMRGFKRLRSADTVTRGHALVQNLRNGFSALTAAVPRPLRLAIAWPHLRRAI